MQCEEMECHLWQTSMPFEVHRRFRGKPKKVACKKAKTYARCGEAANEMKTRTHKFASPTRLNLYDGVGDGIAWC
jgi:hypothetical protein